MNLNFKKLLNIAVQIVDTQSEPAIVELNELKLKDNLSNIRKKLEKSGEIEMNDTLLFAKIRRQNGNDTEFELLTIAREEENEKVLNDIIEEKEDRKIFYLMKHPNFDRKEVVDIAVDIVVQIDDQSSLNKLVTLNPKDNLSNIRKKLEENSLIEMNTLIFAKKCGQNNKVTLAEIAREDENKKVLNNIIENSPDNLYITLTKNSNPGWEVFNGLRKLDYGRTMFFDGRTVTKEANRRAFIMGNCEMTKINGDGYSKSEHEYISKEDCMVKTNFFFNSDIGVDFVNLGISCEQSQNINSKFETNVSYRYTEYRKVSLKFDKGSLKPTEEFEKRVVDAINSEDSRIQFKTIIEDYGQFIPTEVILGGRVYYEGKQIAREDSEENDKEGVFASAIKASNVNVGIGTKNSNRKYKFAEDKYTILIGGKQPIGDFVETTWSKSLENYENWNCIEYKNLISIFQPLSDELRQNIIKSLGKKIRYSNIENYNYEFLKVSNIFKINTIPKDIENIFHKSEDYGFFAAVVDTKMDNNVIFNFQVFCPSKGNPRIKIHFWNTDSMEFKDSLNYQEGSLVNRGHCLTSVINGDESSFLNGSLVIGHHFFNSDQNKIGLYAFAYCLKNRRYVKPPEFTFHTLIISNYPKTDVYDIYRFENQSGMRNAMSRFSNKINRSNSSTKTKPKYISLYCTGVNNCGPIFLKQHANKVNYKLINCGCKQNNSCICRKKTSKENLNYTIFDPK
ncbi:14957_t:CDS:2 [Funneliformis geosporum]|uniref:14957_t:CDS:1 n=1 Tax=Funneliformis geosporum TaxID=1117311 RepID=A0A9W4SKG3_9GLOM|nr:14957_t:CDS:2 [Funneliformis geosporum]